MRSLYTSLIHVRNQIDPQIRKRIRAMLHLSPGVDDVDIEPAEGLITVGYDREQTELAEIVRLLEDCGMDVAGVGQRRSDFEPAS